MGLRPTLLPACRGQRRTWGIQGFRYLGSCSDSGKQAELKRVGIEAYKTDSLLPCKRHPPPTCPLLLVVLRAAAHPHVSRWLRSCGGVLVGSTNALRAPAYLYA
jgi:hypothetical protein